MIDLKEYGDARSAAEGVVNFQVYKEIYAALAKIEELEDFLMTFVRR